jgi:hypothetical protein
MTKLERHCHLLLRAYPVEYRRDRAEEMLGTLLDTTPAGRTWPLPRDIRGLLAGGMQARAALNRRLPLRANVRTAVLVGLVAFLGYNAVAMLSLYWSAERALGHWTLAAGAHFSGVGAAPSYGWGPFIAPTLILMTVVLAWVSRRRVVVLAGALPAVVLVLWYTRTELALGGFTPCTLELATACGRPSTSLELWAPAGWAELVLVACLAGLVALAGGAERPGRGWLWPVVLVSLSPALLAAGSGEAVGQVVAVLLLTIGVVSIAGIAVDARATIAVAVFLLALWLQIGVDYVGPPEWTVPLLAPGAAVAAAVWRLRRQSGRPAGPPAAAGVRDPRR